MFRGKLRAEDPFLSQERKRRLPQPRASPTTEMIRCVVLHRTLLAAVRLLPAVLLLATLGAADVLPEYPSSGVSCQVCHVKLLWYAMSSVSCQASM